MEFIDYPDVVNPEKQTCPEAKRKLEKLYSDLRKIVKECPGFQIKEKTDD